MKILITGGAGFIGYHLGLNILQGRPDAELVVVDCLNDYYDPKLKKDRIESLTKTFKERVTFKKIDICDKDKIEDLFESHQFASVIHLAAQAGVTYARTNPEAYIRTNVVGFFNVIDAAARHRVNRFVYASSSSVYGSNSKMPFSEEDHCKNPMSLYAATKLSNEMISSSYFYTHKLKTIGLRFFNVYGPWGRPDMAYFKWTDAMVHNEPIEMRNKGEMYRDMTYIDDVVVAVSKIIFDYDWNTVSHEVFNVGNRNPVKMADVLQFIQQELAMQPTIVHTEKGSEEPIKTWADTEKLKNAISFVPNTDYRKGIRSFLEWYRGYYNL